jgi:hypothetical protein
MTTSTTRRVALAAGVLSVAIVGVTGLASSALFTSSDSISGSDFVAGTVDITDNDATFELTDTELAPGTVDFNKVVIDNDGSLELRYAMTSDSANTDGKGLRDQLQLTVVAIDAAATCDATAVSSGTAIYSGDLSGASFGDSAAGADTGDRTLAANASEALCMQVEFPNGTAAADNPFQGAATSTSFSFDAEQTLNNS